MCRKFRRQPVTGESRLAIGGAWLDTTVQMSPRAIRDTDWPPSSPYPALLFVLLRSTVFRE